METHHSHHGGMSASISAYYEDLRLKEPTRSDASLFPSYTNLTVPYRVICRERYRKAGIKQRRQFIKEITTQEALQPHALDGVRLHRIFCDPVLKDAEPSEIITLTPYETSRLGDLLDRSY